MLTKGPYFTEQKDNVAILYNSIYKWKPKIVVNKERIFLNTHDEKLQKS